MKVTSILTMGVLVLNLAGSGLADEIVVVDWNGSVDIPDRGEGEYTQSFLVASAPAGSQVTGILCEILVDDRENTNFWCSDYEIGLSSDTTGGPAGYHLVWDNAGGRTDGDADDDSQNDSDIDLSRSADVFNEQAVNQRWYVCVKDTVSFHPVLPPQSGLGCIKHLKLVIQYEAPPPRPDLYDDGEPHRFFDPRTVVAGQSGQVLKLGCHIRNGGTAASGAFRVKFYISKDKDISSSDYYVAERTLSGIATGQYVPCDVSAIFPTNIPVGEYYVGWIIDTEDDVVEANETNNRAYKEAYRLTVAPTVLVPNVVGMTQAAAQSAVTVAGLVVGAITQANSSSVPAGQVISQSPVTGTRVAPSSAVNLTISSGPAQVQVPDVLGMSQTAAQTMIVRVGLVLGAVTQANSSTVPAGQVISQNPAAGTRVVAGSAVNLTLSSGPAQVQVPDVVGLVQVAAQTAIVRASLVLGTVTQASSSTVPAGQVVSQSPAAGTRVVAGSAVNLTLSSGPAQVQAPDVVGMTQAAAQTAIARADLVVGTVTQANSSTVPAGQVISQSPPAGTRVVRGSAVNLTISSGPGQVQVPDVVGLVQVAAQTAIVRANLVLGTVTQANSSTVPAGQVISQSPPAGTRVVAGSAVNLTISSGPALVQVPNVVGMTEAAAQAAITGGRLVVGAVTHASSSSVPIGQVISQSPAAGTAIAPGSAVDLAISSGPSSGSDTGGLVAHWKLDEASGVVAYDNVGQNDGILHGGALWQKTGGMIAGALLFDGYNDYVELPVGSLVHSLTDSTFATWVNWSGMGGGWQRVFDFGSGEQTNMFLTPSLGLGGPMRFAIAASGAGEDRATAPSTLARGWHHVAVTIDATNMTYCLYLDGRVVAAKAAARYTPHDLGHTTENWLGRSQYVADAYFSGLLDDFRIYNRVLSAGDLAQLALYPDVVQTIYVDAHATGKNNGTSWRNAYRYLQDALAAAPFGSEIRAAQGVYTPGGYGGRNRTFQLKNGVAIKGGYAGPNAVNPDARDTDTFLTILSGDLFGNDGPDFTNNQDNCYHVVTGSGANETAILDGCTITGGNADGGSFPDNRGGGMLNLDGHPTISNCIFIENSTCCVGGGMYNRGSSPTVSGCTFISNSAVWGGGMANREGSSPVVSHCTFRENAAPESSGGGMYNQQSSPIVSGCTFIGNWAGWGAGMANREGSSPVVSHCMFRENEAPEQSGGGMDNGASSPTVSGCTFTSNWAGWGGGIANREGSSPIVTYCTFRANSAPEHSGGGVYNLRSSSAVSHCMFTGNTAGYGGGHYSGESDAVIANCVFSGNSAQEGGGVRNYESDAVVTNCTFAGNRAGEDGGGMASDEVPYGSPTLTNCIFWQNSDSGGRDESAQLYGGTPSINYCCIEGLRSTLGGRGNIGSAPLFLDADGADDVAGTEDDDLRLLAGSPCIDAGNNAALPGDGSDLDEDGDTAEPLPIDLAGNPRFRDDPSTADNGSGTAPIVDMGAYEFQGRVK